MLHQKPFHTKLTVHVVQNPNKPLRWMSTVLGCCCARWVPVDSLILITMKTCWDKSSVSSRHCMPSLYLALSTTLMNDQQWLKYILDFLTNPINIGLQISSYLTSFLSKNFCLKNFSFRLIVYIRQIFHQLDVRFPILLLISLYQNLKLARVCCSYVLLKNV